MKANSYQVIIVGGGLAGLVNAIHLSKFKIKILLIEKQHYPKHKVCGEYVSNEVLPYLKTLGFDPFTLGAKSIKRFVMSTSEGKTINAELPLGGFGISRYNLDTALANLALTYGTTIVNDTVTNINFYKNNFIVKTKEDKEFNAEFVIGAYGKRSNIDVALNRKFINNPSPFLAVKMHLKGEFPDDLVGLHNFKGGYCGVSKVENNHINACYISDYKTFKKYKSIDEFQSQVVFQNTHLKQVFQNCEAVFPKPLTISQVSFSNKKTVENHIIMCGDTAGMIHPLCGNGMSMAIKSAELASTLIVQYFNKEILSRSDLEQKYTIAWRKQFGKRLKIGHLVASLFKHHYFNKIMIVLLNKFPKLLPLVIKQTHGKP